MKFLIFKIFVLLISLNVTGQSSLSLNIGAGILSESYSPHYKSFAEYLNDKALPRQQLLAGLQFNWQIKDHSSLWLAGAYVFRDIQYQDLQIKSQNNDPAEYQSDVLRYLDFSLAYGYRLRWSRSFSIYPKLGLFSFLPVVSKPNLLYSGGWTGSQVQINYDKHGGLGALAELYLEWNPWSKSKWGLHLAIPYQWYWFLNTVERRDPFYSLSLQMGLHYNLGRGRPY
ncbi:hypothetical protein [Croceimicrobium hydrocarbonivorans]|uniref:Outer membrane protein beta-barrel domain-containing protein n=1 Tax=Croceimicrobium hydrocarbonivorans TaxID=2761580 RepID=A0A7H0VJH8_9FLAO|nr:hypothetical protein [Croceimicrobium hydrocarbonivorans]QNR25876.1 hypothetical protein H4K34_08525 [Croceimicrobium hydrocarbonivorans]